MKTNTEHTSSANKENIESFIKSFDLMRNEIGKFIVGQNDIVEKVLIAILCGGHVLLEGVPGLGKTALVNTISKVMHLNFRRIQFTPDLLPADILGTNLLVEKNNEKVFQFQKGPIFTNILLADEINRATPKTQSALLETMQEKTVTVANRTHQLQLPFFVLATQNPLEMDGTYALPEAQLDRFFFKLIVELPSHDEFSEILNRTTGLDSPKINPVANGDMVLGMGHILKQVVVDPSVQDYLIKLVKGTHPEDAQATEPIQKYVRYGASPRAAQAILAAAKARALLAGRFHVAKEDVNDVALPALRHRIMMSFEGEAEGISKDDIIKMLIKALS